MFTLSNIFEDDREICCNFTYKGEKFSLWWGDPKAIASFEYENSDRAQTILKPISEVLDMMNANQQDPLCENDVDYRHTKWGFVDFGWGGY